MGIIDQRDKSQNRSRWDFLQSTWPWKYIRSSFNWFRTGYLGSERDSHHSPVLIAQIQGAYSLRRHGTALWRLNRSTGTLEHIFDLPGWFKFFQIKTAQSMEFVECARFFKFPNKRTCLGCGDTAFPSILRIGANKFIVANYTSPVSRCEDWSWECGLIMPYSRFLHQEYDILVFIEFRVVRPNTWDQPYFWFDLGKEVKEFEMGHSQIIPKRFKVK